MGFSDCPGKLPSAIASVTALKVKGLAVCGQVNTGPQPLGERALGLPSHTPQDQHGDGVGVHEAMLGVISESGCYV